MRTLMLSLALVAAILTVNGRTTAAQSADARPAGTAPQVTVVGTNHCLGCALKKAYGAPAQCSRYGRRHSLKVEKAVDAEGKEITSLKDRTLGYLDLEMSDPGGGFASATDADSPVPGSDHDERGWFFTWTPDELEAALGKGTAGAIAAFYGVTAAGHLHGRSVLHVATPVEVIARSLGQTPTALERLVDEVRPVLYRARSSRLPPARDDKIIAAWNGLAISAFARGGQVLGEPRFTARAARAFVRGDTALVTLMLAQNETGTLLPIPEISEIAHSRGALVHTDAAQAVGKLPARVDDLGVDLLSIAGHKLYAPKGVGALYVRRGVRLAPVLLGAGHERGLRPGTENVPYLVGLGVACACAARDQADEATRELALCDELWALLRAGIPGVRLNGHPEQRLPNTLNVSFPGVSGNQVLAAAPEVAASTGSACHAGAEAPSAVLLAMASMPPPRWAPCACRWAGLRSTLRSNGRRRPSRGPTARSGRRPSTRRSCGGLARGGRSRPDHERRVLLADHGRCHARRRSESGQAGRPRGAVTARDRGPGGR